MIIFTAYNVFNGITVGYNSQILDDDYNVILYEFVCTQKLVNWH